MFPPPPPWKQIGDIDPEREYLGFTSRFFLKSVRSLPAFLAQSQRIRKQASTAPGVIGWSLAADLPKLEFFTLSAWEDESSLRDFVATAPHHDVFNKFAGSMREKSILVSFPVLGRDLPLKWKDAIALQDDRRSSQD
jgi:hypothetical protein